MKTFTTRSFTRARAYAQSEANLHGSSQGLWEHYFNENQFTLTGLMEDSPGGPWRFVRWFQPQREGFDWEAEVKSALDRDTEARR